MEPQSDDCYNHIIAVYQLQVRAWNAVTGIMSPTLDAMAAANTKLEEQAAVMQKKQEEFDRSLAALKTSKHSMTDDPNGTDGLADKSKTREDKLPEADARLKPPPPYKIFH